MEPSIKSTETLLTGIAPSAPAHATKLESRKFSPWHKPRKQYIRLNQWITKAKDLFSKIHFDGRAFRYLSLPGDDLLDIRLLLDLCQERNLGLRFLGFNDGSATSDRTEKDVSGHEVWSAGAIDPLSSVQSDNFETLSEKEHHCFEMVKKLGPFDIINLDLCNSFSSTKNPQYHQALHNLCEFQVNSRREPWCLFLTTRGDPLCVNPKHFPFYFRTLKENAAKHREFREGLSSDPRFDVLLLDESDVSFWDKLNNSVQGLDFIRLFANSFGKWLLNLFLSAKWEVRMLESYWYRIGSDCKPSSMTNMLSLGFEFIPPQVSLSDSSGLTTSAPTTGVDEKTLALEVLQRTSNFIDLDQIVDGNEKNFQDMVNSAGRLLKRARYQVSEFAKWAATQRIEFPNQGVQGVI